MSSFGLLRQTSLTCGLLSLAVLPSCQVHTTLAAEQSTDIVAYVLAVSGRWFVDTERDKPLNVASALKKGAVIRTESPSAPNKIVVGTSYAVGRKIIRRDCQTDDCLSAIFLDNEIPNPSAPADLFRRAMEFIGMHPDRSSNAASTLGGTLEDDLLQSSADGRVHLESVFRQMPQGLYTIELTRLTELPPESPVITALDWRPSQPLIVSLPQPGMYTVHLQAQQPDADARVLVMAAGPLAEKKIEEVNQLRKEMDQWPPDLDTPMHNTKRTVFRGCLAYLANQKP
jgi:hypothetical protein